LSPCLDARDGSAHGEAILEGGHDAKGRGSVTEKPDPTVALASLTDLERRVLDLLASGAKSYKEVAWTLNMAARDAAHVGMQIKRKLGVDSTEDAVALLRQVESAPS
jgi:DNA-binding CsgD family transcriptional regulator